MSQPSAEKHATADIGPGWVPLVHEALRACSSVDPSTHLETVRECWGELEILVGGTTVANRPAIDDILDQVRRESRTVCEVSGRAGVLMVSPTGWFRTLDPQTAPEGWSVVLDSPQVTEGQTLHLLRVIDRLHRATRAAIRDSES